MTTTDILETTLFDLPSTPDAIGVVLPSAEFRKIDFSGLDYTTARRAIIEYIQTYYPNDFNDFTSSNGIMMVMEILSGITSKLSLRGDILAREGTLPTSLTEKAVVNHLALINQRIKRQTPATVDIEVSVEQPTATDIEIPAKTSFQLLGAAGTINYEIYRAPGDFTSPIIIPAGKRGVIAYGLEGKFSTPQIIVSSGGIDQEVTITDTDILESPIFVDIITGSTSERWRTITEPIERFGPNDKVVEAIFIESTTTFKFGNNITGVAPTSGQQIQISYRTGGGIRGKIGVGQIDTTRSITPLPPANAPTQIRFRNITPSTGGTDKESLANAKKRAPRDFATHNNIVSDTDYAQAASSYSHPVFGTVSKTIATIRTSKNANLVEIYVLAEGTDRVPVTPSAGLKIGLSTYFSDLNVLTDSVLILDGVLKPIDIETTVVIDRSADASIVKTKVEDAIADFFDIDKWNFGQPFYYSTFIEAIKSIDGVLYLDLLKPTNNILATGKIAESSLNGVGFNEIVVEGKRVVNYYYQPAIVR